MSFQEWSRWAPYSSNPTFPCVAPRRRISRVDLLRWRLCLAHMLAAVLLLGTAACGKPEPLSHEKAAGMIEASVAFQLPLDEDLQKRDPSFGDPKMKREIVRVVGLASKPDGPIGMAGETATVTFMWRWSQGPLASHPYTTIAKIHGDSHGWKLYEDVLKRNLRVSIAGEE
jgi:hypothetical protein